jgi:EmrB/QacA subfamily drug resistance transporter
VGPVTGAPDPQRWKALAVVGVAFLMVVLDGAVVNNALATIQRDLDVSTTTLQWVVSGYALTFGGLLLLGGRAGDLLGRRRLFMVGLGLFSLFSLLCGLSVSAEMLISMRLLQGAAGAILSPAAFSLVSVTFAEGSERNRALGILGGISASAAAFGGVVGGLLTVYAGWHWIFLVNVPVGVGALIAAPFFVRESRSAGLPRRFDLAGATTVTAGLTLLVYGLTQSPARGWSSVHVWGSLAAATVMLAAFLWIESRSRAPLVPLSFFRRRIPAGANAVGFVLGVALFGCFFVVALYMQQVLGYTALRASVAGSAIGAASVVTSIAAQALVSRVGVRPVLLGGLALVALGLAALAHVPPDGDYVRDLLPGFVVAGAGMGLAFVSISVAALAGVGDREAGLASGLINTSQQVGGAVSLAVLTTIASTRTDRLLGAGRDPAAALTGGFALALAVAAGLAVLAVATTLAAMPSGGRRRLWRTVWTTVHSVFHRTVER